jgi:hypothetical protein
VIPCILVNVSRRFRESYSLPLQDRKLGRGFLWKLVFIYQTTSHTLECLSANINRHELSSKIILNLLFHVSLFKVNSIRRQNHLGFSVCIWKQTDQLLVAFWIVSTKETNYAPEIYLYKIYSKVRTVNIWQTNFLVRIPCSCMRYFIWTIGHPMIGSVKNDELERKRSWPNRGTIPAFTWRNRGNTRNLSKDSRCPGRDSNRARVAPEYGMVWHRETLYRHYFPTSLKNTLLGRSKMAWRIETECRTPSFLCSYWQFTGCKQMLQRKTELISATSRDTGLKVSARKTHVHAYLPECGTSQRLHTRTFL